ncbi:hypothetical protein [Synechococcus phage S-B64]|uniref:Uncharacterized protein n=2 Tax=Shandvirus TaxID=2948904 RepID=A0A1Z1LWK6_9CAUD|nr:hypothetical protein KNT63_gp164 [Synechococcus phage S-H35]YP_010095275.1 hypothetical protein KNT88_gp037 [Synechococcus phage S-B64]ARW57044.1 hypothetical protein [Synechococcus phage S-H35]AWD90073.1 hypothetical protein [Synechococcus phage S-B64]
MIKFEHQWGGEDTWYTKSKRWANKQKFPINHLALGFIEWLYKHWVDGKVELEMDSVDRQAEEIKKQWQENEQRPTVEEGPSSVPNLPSLRIRNPVVERGTEEPSTSVAPSSTKIQIPDPWDYSGDWNDAFIGFDNEFRNASRNVEKR